MKFQLVGTQQKNRAFNQGQARDVAINVLGENRLQILCVLNDTGQQLREVLFVAALKIGCINSRSGNGFAVVT